MKRKSTHTQTGEGKKHPRMLVVQATMLNEHFKNETPFSDIEIRYAKHKKICAQIEFESPGKKIVISARLVTHSL